MNINRKVSIIIINLDNSNHKAQRKISKLSSWVEHTGVIGLPFIFPSTYSVKTFITYK